MTKYAEKNQLIQVEFHPLRNQVFVETAHFELNNTWVLRESITKYELKPDVIEYIIKQLVTQVNTK